MKIVSPAQVLNLLARTAVPDDEPGNNAAYEEYLRGFDDVPVLQDVVRTPPPKPRQPDFRRGERGNARREQRPDAYTNREAAFAELALLYYEYAQPAAVAAGPKPKKRASKRKTTPKSTGRAKSKVTRKKH